MLTSIPFSAIRYRCLRCGEERTIPVTDLSVDEDVRDGRHWPWPSVKCRFDGFTVEMSDSDSRKIHHCPDLGIGFEAIVGFDKTEPPHEEQSSSPPSPVNSLIMGPHEVKFPTADGYWLVEVKGGVVKAAWEFRP